MRDELKNPESIGSDLQNVLHTATDLSDAVLQFAEKIQPLRVADEYKKPDPLVTITGRDDSELTLLGPGNVGLLYGPAGSSKTSVFAAIASAMLTHPDMDTDVDTLGFTVYAEQVVWIDTEQEPWEISVHHRTAYRRAGYVDDNDRFQDSELLHVYPAAVVRDTPEGVTPVDVVKVLYRRHNTGSGILLIDGIADLVPSVNAEDAALRVLRELGSMVRGSRWCVFASLHTNRSSNPRGWIGTEIVNRSSCALSIERHESGRLHLHASGAMDKIRHGDRYLVDVWYRWNEEMRMFTTCDHPTGNTAKGAIVLQSMKDAGLNTLRASDPRTLQAYRDATDKPQTPQSLGAWIKRMVKAGHLVNTEYGVYRFRDLTEP